MKQLTIVLALCLPVVFQGRVAADDGTSSSATTDVSATAVEMAREMAEAMAGDPDAIPPEVAGLAAMMAAAVEAASLESEGLAEASVAAGRSGPQ